MGIYLYTRKRARLVHFFLLYILWPVLWSSRRDRAPLIYIYRSYNMYVGSACISECAIGV